MTNRDKRDPYPFWFMFLTFITFVVISTIARQLIDTNQAWGTGACSVALIVAAKSRWELKEQWWFWAALCLGAALQLPLIFFLPWAAPHLTGMGATAFAIPGFIMALGCVFLAEHVFKNDTRL